MPKLEDLIQKTREFESLIDCITKDINDLVATRDELQERLATLVHDVQAHPDYA
jgi:prefoldin subunit 5